MLSSLLVCLAFTMPVQLFAAPLRVGGFVVAPFVMGDAAHPLQGALRDYMEQEIVRKAGVKLTWTAPTSLPRAVDNLKSGNIDILLVVSNSDTNRPGTLDFQWSYLRTRPYLAVLKNFPLQSVQSLQQLAGMDIGWSGGALLAEEIRPVAINWQLLSVPNWQVLNLRKLQAGRIQAVYFENEYSPRYYAQKEHADIQLLKLPISERILKMAYSLKADQTAIARFDRAGATAFSGVQFKTFLEQYIKR